MASNYPSATTGAIGTILRGIQQDQSTSPLATPPASQPSSPVRALVQTPLSNIEAPGSAHVVAIQPALNPTLPGSPAVPNAVPANAPIAAGGTAPVAPGGTPPVAAPGGVVGPQPYRPPAPTPGQPGPGPSNPGPSSPGPSRTPSSSPFPGAGVAPHPSNRPNFAPSQGQILGLATQITPSIQNNRQYGPAGVFQPTQQPQNFPQPTPSDNRAQGRGFMFSPPQSSIGNLISELGQRLNSFFRLNV